MYFRSHSRETTGRCTMSLLPGVKIGRRRVKLTRARRGSDLAKARLGMGSLVRSLAGLNCGRSLRTEDLGSGRELRGGAALPPNQTWSTSVVK